MSLEAGCSYGLAPRRESIASHAGLAAPPKAIHLRLSEETLSKLVTQTNNNKKGKGRALDEEPFMAYDSNTSVPVSLPAIPRIGPRYKIFFQTLRIGDTLHQLMAVKEDQPHEIYKRSASAPDILELVGRITERLMVKQELDADMQDRVRVRSEAAVAERSERHIVVLETDPTAKKGKVKHRFRFLRKMLIRYHKANRRFRGCRYMPEQRPLCETQQRHDLSNLLKHLQSHEHRLD